MSARAPAPDPSTDARPRAELSGETIEMSENLTGGNKVGQTATSWVTNDSIPAGGIARSDVLVNHRRKSRRGGLSSVIRSWISYLDSSRFHV